MILPVWCGKMWRMRVVVVVFSDLAKSAPTTATSASSCVPTDRVLASIFAYSSGLGVAFGDLRVAADDRRA